MFKRALALVGYVPATVEAERNTLAEDLRQMTAARDEMARRNASAIEEGAALAVKYADLDARYQNILQEYEADIRKWRGFEVERQQLQASIDTLNEQVESANELIREMQRQRPQLRLARPAPVVAGDEPESATPAEDEVIVKEHTVEMSARVIVISFEGRAHWTLSSNDHLFKVPVHDRAFLDDPSNKFAKGAVIRAEFLETTFRRAGDGEPYTRRSLERVLEVIQPAPTTTQPLFAGAANAPEGGAFS